MTKIIVVGCGGIFTQMMFPLAQFNRTTMNRPMLLIDGDQYEEKNKTRQVFKEYINKAQESVKTIKSFYPDLDVDSLALFINKDNIKNIIKENDVVIICVDNHKTRKLIEEHCLTLKNVVVISGGNDYTDGNVMVFAKVEDKLKGKTFSELHEEIKNPTDKSPEELSCQELAATSTPQLAFTNFMVGSVMLNELHNLGKGYFHNEVFLDIEANKVLPKKEIKLKGR